MNRQSLISVIIPTYNRAEYIADAINSVLSQKGSWNLEIIVVDDGSTDQTGEIVKKFGKSVDYMKIAHKGRPGPVRNQGISKAKGGLIAFLDSDDLWAPGKLAAQVPLFDDPQTNLTYTNAEVIQVDGTKTQDLIISNNELKHGQSFEGLLKTNSISTLTVMVRLDVLKAAGGFSESADLRVGEDYHLWLRLAAQHPHSFKALARPLAYYRAHPKNVSQADNIGALEQLINVYNRLWAKATLTKTQRLALERQLFTTHENWSRQQNINGNTPAISVVMGIYKDERYVRFAIESILKQTFKDFEYLIIDDGSLDRSAEIAASFKDSRIRLIHQTNHGLVHALNTGVKLARAELIARMDADDISLPKRFEKEIAWIKTGPKRGLVGGFFDYIDENNKRTGTTMTSTTKHIDIVRHMYFDNPIGHGTVLIRKQAIIDAGGYRDDYGPNEDYDLWRRIAQKWEVGQIPEVVYRYRLNPAGISSTKSKLQHELFAKLVKDIWKGPIYKKSLWAIISDAFYYKHLNSPFAKDVYNQYKSHQIRLSFEFLIHGKLLAGYKNSFAALLIYPLGAVRLWNTWLWAPIKLLLRKAE